MSGSVEKEEVELLWEEAVEALGCVSQQEGTWRAAGEARSSGKHRGDGRSSSWGQAGSTSSPVPAGEACSAASEVEAITRLG